MASSPRTPQFAEAVGAAGLTFIGPSPDAMRRMGGKAEAKAIAQGRRAGRAGLRRRGHDGQGAGREAKRIGYPVMIKAVAGGGGRGMRLVAREADLRAALESAAREAQAAFGDARVLLEKVIDRPRHIEVQVFGDAHGNVVHLFERDCSLQRRNQKVIEEAPAPGMSPRAARQRSALPPCACAKAVDYEGAGTVEFLVEGGKLSADAPWYFIEMNTRLQVEHPVTEAITGLDLVEWQLRVASGEPLPLSAGARSHVRACHRGPPQCRGPGQGLPAVDRAHCRLRDAGARGLARRRRRRGGLDDLAVLQFDDRQADRPAVPTAPPHGTRLAGALEGTIVAGPSTNAAFLHALVAHPAFARARWIPA